MSTTISNNRLNVVAKPVAASTKPTVNAATAAPAPLSVNTDGLANLGAYFAPGTATKAVVNGMNVGRLATMPVIGGIIGAAVKDGLSLSNLAWFVVPEAYRNVKAVSAHKESVGRAGANVATSAIFGIGKGIVSGAFVQTMSVATAPLLGLIPASILPFAGIAISLGGMFIAYKGMNFLVKHTGIDQKVANGLTKVFGGDLK